MNVYQVRVLGSFRLFRRREVYNSCQIFCDIKDAEAYKEMFVSNLRAQGAKIGKHYKAIVVTLAVNMDNAFFKTIKLYLTFFED